MYILEYMNPTFCGINTLHRYNIFYNSSVIVKYSKNKISTINLNFDKKFKIKTLQTCSVRLYKLKYFFNFLFYSIIIINNYRHFFPFYYCD